MGRGGFDLEFGSVFMEQLGFMPKFNALVNLTTEHGQLSMDLILSQHTAMNGSCCPKLDGQSNLTSDRGLEGLELKAGLRAGVDGRL